MTPILSYERAGDVQGEVTRRGGENRKRSTMLYGPALSVTRYVIDIYLKNPGMYPECPLTTAYRYNCLL